MDGSLHFPVETAPAPGETVPIAPGVRWLRMKLPFALNHINLWLLEDGPGWTAVDSGFALPETRDAWEHIFAEHLDGRPITRVIVTHFHPDHMGLAAWLVERWQAPFWTTEKEWLHARMMNRDGGEDSARLRHDFAHRAGLDAESCTVFSERQGNYRLGCPVGAGELSAARRTARSSRSAGASGGSSSAKATRRSTPAFIAPRPAC